jgi:redox-sensing transcriptional repressor
MVHFIHQFLWRPTVEKPVKIPDIVIGRLPLYLRALQQLSASGRTVTSSQELGEQLGISAAQIRKDLSQFGGYGKQGTGYPIEYLAEKLKGILKVDRVWDMIVVGAGDVGHAVSRYQGFANRGFRVTMVFDNDPSKIGTKIGEFTVQSMATLVPTIQAAGIKIAMLAVPARVAQAVTDELVKAGIQAILNYAPVNLIVPKGIWVQHIDPATHLQRMSYYLD